MKKGILFICILFISLSAKSQVWEPELVKTMQKYYIIPVEFESFGEWISRIENDSTIRFKEKVMVLENDSIYLNFDFEKPGISSPFENSRLSAKIFGRSRNFETSLRVNERQIPSLLNHSHQKKRPLYKSWRSLPLIPRTKESYWLPELKKCSKRNLSFFLQKKLIISQKRMDIY